MNTELFSVGKQTKRALCTDLYVTIDTQFSRAFLTCNSANVTRFLFVTNRTLVEFHISVLFYVFKRAYRHFSFLVDEMYFHFTVFSISLELYGMIGYIFTYSLYHTFVELSCEFLMHFCFLKKCQSLILRIYILLTSSPYI
jgi:hypothetical protein